MNARILRRLDWLLVLAVAALILFTWPYMKSASYRSGPEGRGQYTSSPQKQLVWIAASAALALVLLVPSYRTLAEAGPFIYGFGILLLALVPVFGREINGARSWIDLPAGVRLQPSELVKLTTLIALARFLSPEGKAGRLSHLAGAVALVGFPAFLIAAQPDLGTALMFVPAAAAMVFVAGVRGRHLLALGVIALALLPALWFGMNATQRSRILSWAQQDRPLTQAERVGQYHHLIQSKFAIGSGGWTGKGLGRGTQNKLNYLGFRNTDFIFAVISEEGGFLAANVVLVLYLVLTGAGLSIALRCRERTGRILAVGLVTLLVGQGLINIAMTVGLVPIVGVTLPFVSYGGSSTLAALLAVALLLNIGLRAPTVSFAREELSSVTDYQR